MATINMIVLQQISLHHLVTFHWNSLDMLREDALKLSVFEVTPLAH